MENNPAVAENVAQANPAINPVNQSKPDSPLFKILIIVVVVLVIGLVGLVAYVLSANKTNVPAATPTPVATPISTPTLEPSPSPVSSASAPPTTKPVITAVPTVAPTQKVNTNPNLKTFTDNTLGISFDFLEVQPDYPKEKVKTSVSGNKVYVYMGSNPTEGQWVEVFQKDKNDTLAQAIKKKFLQGIPEADCYVTDITAQNKFPPSYQVAQIAFPYDENSDIPFFAVENKCPKGYTLTNGINFFLADTNHPDIFLFFSIGQYGINADNGQMWQSTIRFL